MRLARPVDLGVCAVELPGREGVAASDGCLQSVELMKKAIHAAIDRHRNSCRAGVALGYAALALTWTKPRGRLAAAD